MDPQRLASRMYPEPGPAREAAIAALANDADLCNACTTLVRNGQDAPFDVVIRLGGPRSSIDYLPVLLRAISTNTNATYLSLDQQSLGDVGLRSLCAELVRKPQYEDIILRWAGVTQTGVPRLLPVLLLSPGPRVVDLSGNCIGPRGAALVARVASRPASRLQELYFDACHLRDDAHMAAAVCAAAERGVQLISLRENGLHDGTLRAVLVAGAKAVKAVRLSEPRGRSEAWGDFANAQRAAGVGSAGAGGDEDGDDGSGEEDSDAWLVDDDDGEEGAGADGGDVSEAEEVGAEEEIAAPSQAPPSSDTLESDGTDAEGSRKRHRDATG